jgi:hypothetical protein
VAEIQIPDLASLRRETGGGRTTRRKGRIREAHPFDPLGVTSDGRCVPLVLFFGTSLPPGASPEWRLGYPKSVI